MFTDLPWLSLRRILLISLVSALCTCAAPCLRAQTGGWAKIGGQGDPNSSTEISPGDYGTLGVPAPGNVPGGRHGSTSWTDRNGNLWLFGGGCTPAVCGSTFNDIWEFSPSTLEWAWMGGSSSEGQAGAYGALGVPAKGNIPGSRSGATGWVDNNGNLWLFGGDVSVISGAGPLYNDLWEFNPATLEWTWMGGSLSSDASGISGVYGTLGQPAGTTAEITGFSISNNVVTFTSQNTFTAGLVVIIQALSSPVGLSLDGLHLTVLATGLSGSSFTASLPSSFPNSSSTSDNGFAVPSANMPGARANENVWVDKSGNFWIFGGEGYDSVGNWGPLDDLWEYEVTSRQWIWMGGSNTLQNCDKAIALCYITPVYGSLGQPAASNSPGSREGAANWTDSNGNFWIYGGVYIIPNGNYIAYVSLNDLWKFDPVTSEWTWMGGSNVSNQPAVYGTQGQPSGNNFPGARSFAETWTDESGNFWLYGGETVFIPLSSPGSGYFPIPADLWKFSPSTQEWTWVNGANTISPSGVVAPGATPGSRWESSTWTDIDGHLWLFGGSGFPGDEWNDIWEYQASSTAGSGLTISPTSLTFAAQNTGSTSAAQKVTLTNSGTAALSITSIATSGDFAETNNCGTSIAASGNCTISVTFTPTAGGTRTGTLTITDNANGSPQSVALTGTGSTVTLTSSASSLSISSAGGSATATVQLAAAGDFSGMVNLTCAVTYQGSGTAADDPTCSLNPTQQQVSGTGTVSATLTVNTTGTSARLEGHPFLHFGGGAMAALLLFVGAPARRRRRWGMLVLLCFAIAGSCLGCAGGTSSTSNGGGNTPSNPGTTTGNYVVAVKATSGTVTTSITIPLTVQ